VIFATPVFPEILFTSLLASAESGCAFSENYEIMWEMTGEWREMCRIKKVRSPLGSCGMYEKNM